MGKPADGQTKATIFANIRDDGMSDTEASRKYGVSGKKLRQGIEDLERLTMVI